MDITEVRAGDILGYKYIGFGGLPEGAPGLPAFEGVRPGNGTVFNLFVAARTAQAFQVGVWIDGPWEGGVVRITAYDPYKGAFTVKASDGSEYRGAEVTSEGFFIYGLPPYRY